MYITLVDSKLGQDIQDVIFVVQKDPENNKRWRLYIMNIKQGHCKSPTLGTFYSSWVLFISQFIDFELFLFKKLFVMLFS